MSKRKVERSQDGSAYWHYVMNGHSNSEGRYSEHVDANPDQLSEEDTIIKQSVLSDEDENNLASYYRLVSQGILRKLAPRQREIWKLRFFRWCVDEEIAEKLGISLSAVRAHLARAGVKIKEEIEKQQKIKRRMDGHYFNDGFKKSIHIQGQSKTDADFEKRLIGSEKEIDNFCQKHPELRRDA